MSHGSNLIRLRDWAMGPVVNAEDQLQGRMDIAQWADAQVSYSGDLALASFAAIDGSSGLKAVATPSSTDAQGFLRATVSGDFVYCARWQLSIDASDIDATAQTQQAHFVYVDHASSVDTGNWYGGGVNVANTTLEARQFGSMTGLTAANYWDTLANGKNYTWDRGTAFDVALKRSGTTLTIYGAPAGHGLMRVSTHTVGTGAGLVGMRIRCGAATTEWRVIMTAFARLTAVPGF